jgi:hypothetical protein
MVGITSLLNVLDPKQQKQSASTANGPSYGASVYGGGKK